MLHVFRKTEPRSSLKLPAPSIPAPALVLPPELLRNCLVVPERGHILPHLPKNITFCEIGVALGDFSARVLEACSVKHFITIDIFTLHDYPDYWGGEVGQRLGGMKHRTFIEKRFSAEIKTGRMSILEGRSVDTMEQLPDRSVDVFYVDAQHDYDGVKADLGIARRKIAPGGIIWLNDYTFFDHKSMAPYGVVQAANEFMMQWGWEMIFYAFHPEGFCDIAIREKP